jgi:ubiquitin-protein ligase
MPSQIDLEQLKAEALALADTDGHRWQVTCESKNLIAYIVLRPRATEDRFGLRLDFGDALGAGPPSVRFCHPDTHALAQASDWPAGLEDYFKPPPNNGLGWICMPISREGRQQHSEWNAKGWRPTRVIWQVVQAIQDVFDTPSRYRGRRAA